jgi:hypothetical protein
VFEVLKDLSTVVGVAESFRDLVFEFASKLPSADFFWEPT